MMEIRIAALEDVGAIVTVHRRAFSRSFLTLLGPQFLTELYRGFIATPSGICIVAIEHRAVLGFVAGTTRPEEFFRMLLRKRWYAFAWSSARALIRRPLSIARKLIGAATYRGEKPAGMHECALLSSIAVEPNHSGKGIGRALVDAFCGVVSVAEQEHVYLITDGEDNERTLAFYRKLGFTIESSFLKDKSRRMFRYVKRVHVKPAIPRCAPNR